MNYDQHIQELRSEIASREGINIASLTASFEVLEQHDLILSYGFVYISKNSENQYYVSVEEQPDRGSPSFDYWSVTPMEYYSYKTPTLKSLPLLLSTRFFNATLFDVFIADKNNLELMLQLVSSPETFEIESTFVRNWFAKNKTIALDAIRFRNSIMILELELPGIVHACQFKNDQELMVNILYKNEVENIYDIQQCWVDIPQKTIRKDAIIPMAQGLPFFTFAKNYPIQPILFGEHQQYLAEVVVPSDVNKADRVILKKGTEILLEYEYPRESNLGRFWAFQEKTSLPIFKNSVLFMYSIRNHRLEEDYYVLRFEAVDDQILLRTKTATKSDSAISFSPNGLMVCSASEERGRRSTGIRVFQL